MKLKVPKSTLDKAIKSVAKAVPSKGIQPILNNILLESNGSSLSLNATDLDLSIEAIVPAENESTGSITLSAKKLEEIVSRLDEDDVYINVDYETQKTSLMCKKANFDLTGISADDFPKQVKPESGEYFSISKNKFSRIVDMVQFAASRYDVSNILGGVYISIQDGEDASSSTKKVEFAGTDGNRLSSYETEVEFLGSASSLPKQEVIVPVKVMVDVQRILDTSVDDEVKIAFLANQIVFRTEDRLIVSRLLEGVYPRFKQLIPGEDKLNKFAELNRKELLSSLERVAVMANEITNLVHLSFNGDTLTTKSSNMDFGGAEDNIAIQYDGEPIDIFFNVKYLIEAVKCMDSERIQISMSEKLNPVVIKPVSEEAFVHLIMPIKHK